MSKKSIDQYLDNEPVTAPDDEQLLALLQEVEDLPDHDPGDMYWQHFNNRLQGRIAEADEVRAPWWQRLFLPMGLAVTAAALLVFFLLPPSNETGQPLQLASLDDQQLSLIAAVYLPIDEEEDSLAGEEMDVLLDVFDDSELDYFPDHEELPDAETLKQLWEQEG